MSIRISETIYLGKATPGSGGGGDQHNLGYYATQAALEEAHPTAEAGDWAIVGATDTVWIWDTDTSAWVDSVQKGQVTSVNGQTGAVTVQPTLVSGTNIKTINGSSVLGSGDLTIAGFVPQYTTMPTASADHAGEIAQYAGEPTENYEQGYFYICNPIYVDAEATISQTTGSGLTNLAVDVATFETAEQPSGDETVNFVAASVSESINPTQFQFDTAIIEINPTTFLSKKTELYSGDWANVVRIYFSYDGDNDSFGAAVFDADNNELSNSGGLNPTFFGISVVSGTLPSSGSWGTNLAYTPVSVQWSKGGNTVTISDYGITYSGTPVDGDTLTVVYTAPTITGYAWEQIDVQPSGGGEGIEWAVQLDFDKNVNYGGYYTIPVWKVSGGLPDGNYEYYFQTRLSEGQDKVTYKVYLRLYTDSGTATRYFSAQLACVYNGEFITSDSTYKPQTNDYYNTYVYTDGGDLILFNRNAPFCSSIYNRYPIMTDVLEGLFKISKIKNVDTGDEYTPEGHIYKENEESYNDYLPGAVIMYSIINLPQIPEYCYSTNFGYDGSPLRIAFNNNAYIVNQDYRQVGEIDIAMRTSLGGEMHVIIENAAKSYKAKILKRTAEFANGRFLANSSGNLIFDAGFATADTRTVYVSFATKGSRVAASVESYSWLDPSTYPIEIAFDTVGSTITTQNLGVIAQFNNEIENALYTEGYFYKAAGTTVVVPESATTEVPNYNDITVAITNITDVINELETITGWSADYIRSRLNESPYWSIEYDFGNNTLTYLYWGAYGTIPSSSPIYGYFSVSTTGSYAAGVNFGCYVNYVPSYTEIQNQHWEQVSVQDVNALLQTVTGYDATKTQVLKNVNGTLTWVDE